MSEILNSFPSGGLPLLFDFDLTCLGQNLGILDVFRFYLEISKTIEMAAAHAFLATCLDPTIKVKLLASQGTI